MKISASLLLAVAAAAKPVSTSAALAECFENAGHFHPDDWSYCQPILEDVFMYYTPLEEEGNVMIGLHVAQDSHGWSALAFGGNGGMKGASEIVVRRNEEEDDAWIVEDRHSNDYVTPLLDDQQDAKLIFANQTEDGETSWGVLVPMNSCDEAHDYPIRDIRGYMMWALGNDHTFGFHGTRRGQFHANLLREPKDNPSTEGQEFIDMRMPDVSVEMGEGGSDPTNPYICSFFDLEELSEGRYGSGEKIHVTRFSPILPEESKKYVHHMILYSCSGADESAMSHRKVQAECGSMPQGCREMKWSWALGASDTILPPDVGMPVAEEQRFVVLQTHYYNPNVDQVTDSSGVRAYFTTDLREQEAGVLQLNGGVSGRQREPMPAGQAKYQLSPFVVPHDCTLRQWSGPLNILAVGHHMHLHGSKMEISVERDGVNIGLLRNEHHYDFNHQSQEEPNPVLRILLPGDQITTKCTYDTSSATEEVSFGDLTQQEMCYSPVLYYPRQENDSFGFMVPMANLTQCLSSATDDLFTNQNVSLCAQELYNNVPEALGFGRRFPVAFGLLAACNGGELYSQLLDNFEGICPACQANAEVDCTEEEIMAHAQEFCTSYCKMNLGVSLYPDLSNTYAFDSGTYGCPAGTNAFHTPQLAEPAQCEPSGNVNQEINLQPFMSSGHTLKAVTTSFFVGAVLLTLVWIF